MRWTVAGRMRLVGPVKPLLLRGQDQLENMAGGTADLPDGPADLLAGPGGDVRTRCPRELTATAPYSQAGLMTVVLAKGS